MFEARRMLAPVAARIQALIGRAILAAVTDSGGIQIVKVSGLADETIDKMDHPQPFGLTSNCPAGGQAVVAFVGGSRDQGIVLVVDHVAHRKKDLKEGETAIYSTAGTYVYLKEDGTVEIETAGTKVQVNGQVVATETISTDVDVEAAGDVSDATGTLDKVRQDLADLKAAYDVHVHPTAPVGPPSPPQAPPL